MPETARKHTKRAAPQTEMTFHEYVGIQAVNFSTLKEMRKSPLHYATARQRNVDTVQRAIFRAVHTAVLEPQHLSRDYVVYEGKIRRGKEWEAFELAHQDQSILKVKEYQRVLRIAEAVRAYPPAMKYLAKGRGEQTIRWTDKKTGLPCKGRVDWISESCPAHLDLKACKDVRADLFGFIAFRLGHHIQASFYHDGLLATFGVHLPAKILAYEDCEPYDCALFDVDEAMLELGTLEYGKLMAQVAKCRATNFYPGRYATEQPLVLPEYAFTDPDEDFEAMSVTVDEDEVESEVA